MPTLKIFYCYTREDQALRDELDKHLGMMKRQDQITGWYDQNISAGKQWETEIDLHLNTANIILLLISPDFMNSDYCYSVEMKQALRRHNDGDARVIPILLRPVDWENAPFSKLQVLPTNSIPVNSWDKRDDAFVNVAKAIRKTVQEMLVDQLKHEDFHKYQQKQYIAALSSYEQTIDIDQHNSLAYSNKGYALYALKRYEDALQAFEDANQLDPENAMTHNGRGKTLYKLHCYEDALNALDEALRIDSNLAEAYRDKADVLEALARQARVKADQIDNPQSNTPILSPSVEKEESLIRLGEMISSGKIKVGERVYVSKKPDQLAKIIDGHTVEFQGKRVRINEWAKKMAGWSAISIYNSVYLERTRLPLGSLREET